MWVARNGGPGAAPAVMGDFHLLAACGKYVANGEKDVWVFLIQVELANAGVIPP